MLRCWWFGSRIQRLRQRSEMSMLSFWSWSRLCVPCCSWSYVSFFKSTESWGFFRFGVWVLGFLFGWFWGDFFFLLQPMIWTAMLVSLNLVFILCNHSREHRFLFKVPRSGTIMLKLLTNLLEHYCWCCSLKLWVVQLWNYLQLTLILLCSNYRGFDEQFFIFILD